MISLLLATFGTYLTIVVSIVYCYICFSNLATFLIVPKSLFYYLNLVFYYIAITFGIPNSLSGKQKISYTYQALAPIKSRILSFF